MEREYSISDAEWKVMDVLWEHPNSTIKEITGLLSGTGWGYSTIRTLVFRLNEKGAIGADTSDSRYRYYPVASEEECRNRETAHFLNKIYNGSVKMLMNTLVGGSKLSSEEVRELMSIIDKMEEG